MKWKKWISTGLSMIMAVSAFALTAPRVRGAEEKPTEPGLWITEIYQNDVKREDLFDNSSDHMEFVEVINTSDRSVELGSDYTLWYEYPSGDAYVMKELTISARRRSPVGRDCWSASCNWADRLPGKRPTRCPRRRPTPGRSGLPKPPPPPGCRRRFWLGPA